MQTFQKGKQWSIHCTIRFITLPPPVTITLQVHLIFANNGEDDILLKDRLDALASKHSNFKVTYILSTPSPAWKVRNTRELVWFRIKILLDFFYFWACYDFFYFWASMQRSKLPLSHEISFRCKQLCTQWCTHILRSVSRARKVSWAKNW